MNINANNPGYKSWVEVEDSSDFPVQNLPYGIFRTDYLAPGAGVAIGRYILDLTYLQDNGFFIDQGLPTGIFNQRYLNDFMALGRTKTRAVRERISELLREDNNELQGVGAIKELVLIPMAEAEMLMPVNVSNYTDFYSSESHARNVGSMFRDPENALFPNWKHMPVGYHGRASSIIISGTPVHRPKGQVKRESEKKPVFIGSERLDFELEMAFVTCKENELGDQISVNQAEDYIFGMVLFNDMSARDIQKWEYVPLGPFQGKSFASSISPWIVTLDALEPFRVEGPVKDIEVLPYLKTTQAGNFDINLSVSLLTENKSETVLSETNFKQMYWNMAQQLAHQTANGCNVKCGDLYASGTISGNEPGTYGSLLELSLNGRNPVILSDGSTRSFLEDGDEVVLKGYAQNEQVRIGFGVVRTKILPVK